MAVVSSAHKLAVYKRRHAGFFTEKAVEIALAFRTALQYDFDQMNRIISQRISAFFNSDLIEKVNHG